MADNRMCRMGPISNIDDGLRTTNKPSFASMSIGNRGTVPMERYPQPQMPPPRPPNPIEQRKEPTIGESPWWSEFFYIIRTGLAVLMAIGAVVSFFMWAYAFFVWFDEGLYPLDVIITAIAFFMFQRACCIVKPKKEEK